MSDTIPYEIIDMLQKLRADAQYDVVQARGREEAYAHILEMLEGRSRRKPGRPKKEKDDKQGAEIVELPERVAGGLQETPVEESVA